MLNNLLNKFTEVITNVKLNMFISGGLCTAGILKLQTGNYLIALINLTLGVVTLCAYWGDCEGKEEEWWKVYKTSALLNKEQKDFLSSFTEDEFIDLVMNKMTYRVYNGAPLTLTEACIELMLDLGEDL